MKRAFLVGINTYPQSALRGCVADVHDMSQYLASQGFEVKTLLDADCTQRNMLDGLRWLTDGAVPGDALVFHYSGHGSQVADTSRDEADKLDEILCPVDVFSGRYITDDQLRQAFQQVPPGVVVDIFLDCCHSGTGFRDFVVEPQENDVVGHRYLDPSLFGAAVGEPTFALREFVLTPNNGAVLWSGCRDTQTSADAYIGGAFHGAFTYCLMEALRAEPGATRRRLEQLVSRALLGRGFVQLPQLETDDVRADLPLFL